MSTLERLGRLEPRLPPALFGRAVREQLRAVGDAFREVEPAVMFFEFRFAPDDPAVDLCMGGPPAFGPAVAPVVLGGREGAALTSQDRFAVALLHHPVPAALSGMGLELQLPWTPQQPPHVWVAPSRAKYLLLDTSTPAFVEELLRPLPFRPPSARWREALAPLAESHAVSNVALLLDGDSVQLRLRLASLRDCPPGTFFDTPAGRLGGREHPQVVELFSRVGFSARELALQVAVGEETTLDGIELTNVVSGHFERLVLQMAHVLALNGAKLEAFLAWPDRRTTGHRESHEPLVTRRNNLKLKLQPGGRVEVKGYLSAFYSDAPRHPLLVQ